jgi:hypothetical protein
MGPPTAGILLNSDQPLQNAERLLKHPVSPRYGTNTSSSDDILVHQPRTQSSQHADDRVPNPAHSQPDQQRRQSTSHPPRYRFKFRQPFHLGVAKRIFIPSLSQYLEDRSTLKTVRVPTSDGVILGLDETSVIDQPEAVAEPARLEATIGHQETGPSTTNVLKEDDHTLDSSPADHGEPSASGVQRIRTSISLETHGAQETLTSPITQTPEDLHFEPGQPSSPSLCGSKASSAQGRALLESPEARMEAHVPTPDETQDDVAVQKAKHPVSAALLGDDVSKGWKEILQGQDNPSVSVEHEDIPDVLDDEYAVAVSVPDAVDSEAEAQPESSQRKTSLFMARQEEDAKHSDCSEDYEGIFVSTDDEEVAPGSSKNVVIIGDLEEPGTGHMGMVISPAGSSDIKKTASAPEYHASETGEQEQPLQSVVDDSRDMAEETLDKHDTGESSEGEGFTLVHRDKPFRTIGSGKRPVSPPSHISDAGGDQKQTLDLTDAKLASVKSRGLRLLSLDNGFACGLSTLFALKGLMDRLNSGRMGTSRKKPCEVFDLIGGTGTGG